MLNKYPRKIVLRDNREIILKPMEKGDGNRLWEFFQKVPGEDKVYFKNDVTKRETIEQWEENLDYKEVLPILAWDGEKIVGDATLHRRKLGWKSKVGDVRVVIDKEYRNKGLGTALIRELKSIATKTTLNYLVVELVGSQKSAVDAFQKMGFEKKAHIENFVTDWSEKSRDLFILLYSLEDVSEIYY
ncbi:MAG: GNAT family N-acetyltransferase [Deltaproteobacteria bacterium]|nr:GNAT family N-acetyltransferase [Deltaproteobacteria bacterium]